MAHIPIADTRSLGDISFDSALEQSSKPCVDYNTNE